MLSYSGILECNKKGRTNYYKVNNRELLEYISIKEKNSLNFLVIYFENVLKDSGIWHYFEDFFNNNDKQHFEDLKENYVKFIIENTSIKKEIEPRRIFTKILNPLSYIKKKHGTEGGFLSSDIINYNELMYNRKNWRDLNKSKNETRKEYLEKLYKEIDKSQNAFIKFSVEKAKRLIKKRHNEVSEVNDEVSNGSATQVHHIFPVYEFPEIQNYLENLILLTATQHYTKAHPNNNTKAIDKDYQLLCLLSKSESIKISVKNNDGFYTIENFIYVVNTGLDTYIPYVETISIDCTLNIITEFIIGKYNCG